MEKKPARFHIIDEPFGEETACRLLDTTAGRSVQILPFLGGTINSFVIQKSGTSYEMIDGYRSFRDASKITSTYKGSNLFPFPNRIEDGRYCYEGKEYRLPINFPQENNAIHGLVYDQAFSIGKRTVNDTKCTLELEYTSPGEQEGYPFRFRLRHLHSLNGDGVYTCCTAISNLSDRTIPIGHGFHPYFSAGSGLIDDLFLQFDAENLLEVDSRNIPTGARFTYNVFGSPERIGETRLDNCFSLMGRQCDSELTITNPQLDIRLTIFQERGAGKYNYLQLYTPPHRRSLAVEPMTCIPNSFNNSEGLIHLLPGKTTGVSWGIHVDG